MSRVKLGVDIGGTAIKTGLFTEDGTLIQKYEMPTDKSEQGSHILRQIGDKIREIQQEHHLKATDCMGIGVGIPGPVDEAGVVLGCVNLGWPVFSVEKSLEEELGMPVRAANDANVAALGECRCGAGRGRKQMVMVTLGTGVGGGVILDGRILTGKNGAAGEIGHFPVNPEETVACSCGKYGCLEQYASATGVVRTAKKILHREGRSADGYETAKDIFDKAKEGDAIAGEAVRVLGTSLGIALASTACLLNPECFVIGGGVSAAGDILLDELKKSFHKNVFAPCADVDFVLAELGNDAGIYGAAALVDEIATTERR